MRSMYRFSIIALAVASLALVAAGAAFGAAHEGKGVKIGGSITGGFGQISTSVSDGAGSDESTSNLSTQTEAVLDFAASQGAVSTKARIELVEGNGNVDNTRHYVRWQVNDMIGLQFNGVSFGSEAGSAPFGATVVGHLTSLAGPGHYAGYAMWAVGGVNKSNFDINVKLDGGMNLGAVLSGGFDLGGGAGTTETQTVVPYFNGKFGGIGVHVYAASASGKDALGDSVTSSETSLTGIWKGDGMQFSLQYVTGKIGDALKTTGMALSGRASGISFHYITDVEEPDAGGDATFDKTDIGVAYTAGINDGAEWSIGYGMLTDNLDSATFTAGDVTGQSQIMFSVRGKY